jgi:aminoglycoside phosphotransferase (APT) family kinase protein
MEESRISTPWVDQPLPARLELDAATRRWIEMAVDRVASIRTVRRLGGGVSSVAQEVLVDTPRQLHIVMLRRFPSPIPRREAVAAARAEAAALRRLEGHRIVPRLLAVDEMGESTTVPATLQTRLRGRPDLSPRDLGRWVSALAGFLADLRSWPIRRRGLRQWRAWLDDPRTHEPPAWSRQPDRWATAIDLARRRSATSTNHTDLIHRDFHPGNVLFDHGRLAGVVDWGEQCAGPIEVDVSKCLVETAVLLGTRPAERLRREAERVLELDHDPTWDLITAAEIAPWTHDLLAFNRLGAHLTLSQIQRRLDQVVMRALDELGH